MQNLNVFLCGKALLTHDTAPTRRACLLAGLGAAWPAWGADPAPLRVLAASDLKFALALLLDKFQKESGERIEVNYGSSGNFARQIRQGLPADLFLSADDAWVEQLVAAGLTLRQPNGQADTGVVYGKGRLALYVPRDSALVLDGRLAGVRAGWSGVRKFAIANPEHAPYGRAAREALQALDLWEQVKSKLVLGENIAQATQFVATGAAQAGITALSLALAPEVAQQGRHLALPESLHAPLRQRMVMLRGASPRVARLYGYLQSAAARSVFTRYGFVV